MVGGQSWNQEIGDAQYKICAGAWETNVRKGVGKKFFNFMQFVDESAERYGSQWQDVVCKIGGVPQSLSERFWEDRGRKIARATINRRRQNTAIAMRKKFKGECCSDGNPVGVLVLQERKPTHTLKHLPCLFTSPNVKKCA